MNSGAQINCTIWFCRWHCTSTIGVQMGAQMVGFTVAKTQGTNKHQDRRGISVCENGAKTDKTDNMICG